MYFNTQEDIITKLEKGLISRKRALQYNDFKESCNFFVQVAYNINIEENGSFTSEEKTIIM